MRIDTPADLGAAISRTRREHGLTQEEVALVVGAGPRFIGDLERGKPTVQLGKVLRVIQALGLRLDLQGTVDEDA